MNAGIAIKRAALLIAALSATLASAGTGVNLTSQVTGILPAANGGSGSAYTEFTGPTTSKKTFTLPNASATVLTDNAVVTVPQGGTGLGSCTAYAVITGGTTSTAAFQCLASLGSSGYVLTSNGAGALPTWQVNPGASGGSVTSVSVATANGFAGTVATATTTPAITLTTSVTGLMKGNGTAAAAYAGTSCTNQFPRSLDLNGAATCASVAIGSDVSGLGTGVATFLATPSGANLASALTTALPDSKGGTGLTALGTGVATALGINVGSAGAPVTFNGAGGTPSSLTLTNATGLPAAQVPAVLLTSGTSRTLANAAEIIICTSTCTVTPPATLTAGAQFCVQNDDNVSTVITLAAVSGIQYESTARTSYGTANHTMTSGGAVKDQMCMVAISTTKFNVFSSTGTWTNN